MGCLPIRDMLHSSIISPDGAKQFAAEALSAGLAVTHHPPARTENGDAQAIEDRLQLNMSAVQTASRATAAFDMADHLFTLGPVLHVQPQDCFAALRLRPGLEILMSFRCLYQFADLVVQDKTLLLEYL